KQAPTASIPCLSPAKTAAASTRKNGARQAYRALLDRVMQASSLNGPKVAGSLPLRAFQKKSSKQGPVSDRISVTTQGGRSFVHLTPSWADGFLCVPPPAFESTVAPEKIRAKTQPNRSGPSALPWLPDPLEEKITDPTASSR